MTKKKAETRATRRPIPYDQLVKMLTSGKSYKEIANALDRYDEKSADPTKPIRAIVSRMKTVGYTNQKGEFGKLKMGKRKQKAAKKSAKTNATKPKAALAEKPETDPVAEQV